MTLFPRGKSFLAAVTGIGLAAVAVHPASNTSWTVLQPTGEPTARHECAFVETGGKFYLIGGRGDKPIDVYDPAADSWTEAARPPVEIHHFQPVVFEGRIYVLGALTGAFPSETPVPYVLIYDPARDTWSRGPDIPANRRRGAAGVVVRGGKIYVVCGIIDGHNGDYVNWLDEFDPGSGQWRQLPDAPRPRDHFQAAVVDDKLYAAGGRTSSFRTNQVMELTISKVDVYDFVAGRWSTLGKGLPTERAGTTTVVLGDSVVVIGGESVAHQESHSEVEAFNTATSQWEELPSLVRGRHGTGAVVYEGSVYTAAGSGNRGGGPELTSLERLQWGND